MSVTKYVEIKHEKIASKKKEAQRKRGEKWRYTLYCSYTSLKMVDCDKLKFCTKNPNTTSENTIRSYS